jgi:predicted TIM-barrel fold metal-dependent hydrolase
VRSGFRVLDTDAHQMEPPTMWAEYMEPRFADRAPALGEFAGGRRLMQCEGEPLAKQDGSYPVHSQPFLEASARAMQRFTRARAAGFSAASRLEDMDEYGVDAQVIYPTVGGQLLGKPFHDEELLAACCRAYNDWSLAYCAAAPARLRMAAMLPVQNVDLAVEEAQRAAEAGAACFYVRPNPVAGRNLYHVDYDPLWRTIAALERPVCLHDSGSPWLPSFGDRMETHTSGHIIAHPFEAMVAMMSLIWFGVIERHPTLRVVHVEADAGWLPYWLQRMEQHYEFSGNAEHPDLRRTPTEYFRSNFLVAARGDERTLPAAVELVGAGQLTFNTDYPHPDGTFPRGIADLEAQPIGREAKQKIFWDNAAHLFGAAA